MAWRAPLIIATRDPFTARTLRRPPTFEVQCAMLMFYFGTLQRLDMKGIFGRAFSARLLALPPRHAIPVLRVEFNLMDMKRCGPSPKIHQIMRLRHCMRDWIRRMTDYET